MQQLNYKNRRAVFSTWSVPTGYKQEKVRAQFENIRSLINLAVAKVTTVQVTGLPL
jgi:hypothetical protein